jgi:hypothetical protein
MAMCSFCLQSIKAITLAWFQLALHQHKVPPIPFPLWHCVSKLSFMLIIKSKLSIEFMLLNRICHNDGDYWTMLESLFEHHDSVINNDGVMRNVMNNDENKQQWHSKNEKDKNGTMNNVTNTWSLWGDE